ncbi:MAG TPA: DnaJ domain-containing protein [Kofleriaceae bacterium]|nr:DnaJ domain-containing protein [Kofleriaceae bacterium]
MAELARGRVTDRPWGRTFATLGLRGVTGQLGVVADGKRFLVGFERGAVVAAASPLASDAAARVALTSHLVSSSQVAEIARRQAAVPHRDEVELIAELARLGPDHALRLRRRVVAQRAARTFSISQGEFVVTDRIELDVPAGCELDVRAVVYMGARSNLSEPRLAAELDQLGAWFQLREGIDDDLPQFGFGDAEQPVVERLRDGGTLAEIEAFAGSFIDGRTVRAVIYALAACNACAVEPAAVQPRSKPPSQPAPRSQAARPTPSGQAVERPTQPMATVADPTQPMATVAGGGAVEPVRTATQPLTRSPAPSVPPPDPRSPRPTPDRGGGIPPLQAARPATMPLGSRPGTVPPPDLALPKTTTRVATVPPPPRPPTSPPDARGDAGAGSRNPTGDATGWDTVGSSPRAVTRDAVGREKSSGSLRLPPEEALEDQSARTRRLSEPVEWSSSASIRLPPEEAMVRESARTRARARGGSSGSIPVLHDEALREGSSGSIRIPELPDEISAEAPGEVPDHEARRQRSSGSIRIPDDPERGRGPGGDPRRRPSSSPGVRGAAERGDAGPGLVLRPAVAPRPPAVRPLSRVDSPESHGVKALIAQRLQLLDRGADHFQLLGVASDVAAEPLRKAYFALARQLHPDRLAALGISDDGRHAQRLFAEINAGFAILSDPARRAKYLDVLRRGGEAAIRAEQARAEELTRRIVDAEEAFRRAELALRRDQPQAAVTELERAVQLHPEEADYQAALAWARFCAAPDKQAVAAATRTALDRAIQRAPRSVTPRFYLGRVERMLGRDPEALRHFREVLAAAPGHADAASEVRALEARLGAGPGRKR